MKRVLAVVVAALLGGIGGGLALLGEWPRALAWLAGAVATVIVAMLVSPWLLLLVAVPVAGSIVDAVLCARRTAAPLRLLAPWPLAIVMTNLAIAMLLGDYVVTDYLVPNWRMMPTLHEGDHVLIDKLSLRVRPLERGELIEIGHPCSASVPWVGRAIALGGDTVEIRCGITYVNGKPVASELADGDCMYDSYEGHGDRSAHQFPCSRYRETLDGHAFEVIDDPDRPRDGGPPEHDFPRRGAPEPGCGDDTVPVRLRLHGALRETKPAEQAARCEPQLHYIVPDDYVFMMVDNRMSTLDSRTRGAIPIETLDGRASIVWWHR